MKKYLPLSFLALLLLTITSCSVKVTNPSYNSSAFNESYAKVINHNKQDNKSIQKLLTSYQAITERDLKTSNTKLENNSTDFEKQLSLCQSISKRNQRLRTLSFIFPLDKEIINEYSNAVNFYEKITREKGFTYSKNKFEIYFTKVKEGEKLKGKPAYKQLLRMQLFAPDSLHYDSLKYNLKSLAHINTLVTTSLPQTLQMDEYKLLASLDFLPLNTFLQTYHINPDLPYDEVLTIHIDDPIINGPHFDESTTSCSATVQDGYETIQVEVEECQPCINTTKTVTCGDSTYTVTECVPQPPKKVWVTKTVERYITVYADVTERSVSMDAKLGYDFRRNFSNEEVVSFQSKKYSAESSSYQTDKSYSGDSRAVSGIASCIASWPSAPDENNLTKESVNKVYKNLPKNLYKWIDEYEKEMQE